MSRDDDRLRWVLGFAQLDLGQLSADQWRNLERDVRQFASAWRTTRRAGAERTTVRDRSLPGPVHSDAKAPRGDRLIAALQTDLRQGLAALGHGRRWEVPPLPRKTFLVLTPGMMERKDGGIHRDDDIVGYYAGSTRAVFFAGVKDLLVIRGTRLLFCRRPECRAAFLPRRGQERYCTLSCSKRARWARYRKRHPHRHRDYREEYRRKRAARAKHRATRHARRHAYQA